MTIILLFVLSALFLMGGVTSGVRALTQRRYPARATAVVTELIRTGSAFIPVLSMDTPQGRFDIKYEAARKAVFRIGQTVELSYDPKEPRKAVISGDSRMWTYAAVFTAIGLILTVYAIRQL